MSFLLLDPIIIALIPVSVFIVFLLLVTHTEPYDSFAKYKRPEEHFLTYNGYKCPKCGQDSLYYNESDPIESYRCISCGEDILLEEIEDEKIE